MYIPKPFCEDDQDALVAFMTRHSFAVVVSVADSLPVATHLPLSLRREGGELFLRGHFAKANPRWQQLEAGETLVIFSGPHAYVSPEHYDKRESVPTWNYLAVHAYGVARLIDRDDRTTLETLMADLVVQHEPAYQEQWDALSDAYKLGMMRGVVGFELHVTRLEGKAKLSQNKSREEQAKIATSLLESADQDAAEVGAEMKRRLEAES